MQGFSAAGRMNTFLTRLALMLIVALVVGGTTYVVLTIMEILRKR